MRRLFPDSQAVSQIGEALTTRKNDEIKRQSDRLDEFLAKGWMVDTQNPESVAGVLRIVAEIDPQHPLLIDPRLPSAYAEQTQLALKKEEIALAQSLTQAGLIVAPADRTLKDLNDTVERELVRRAQIARMAELRRKLSDELANAASLSAFDPVHDDLLLLQAGTPNDPALRTARQRIEILLDGEMSALTSRQAHDDAQALLARYADVVTVSYVETKRVALDTGEQRHLAENSAGFEPSNLFLLLRPLANVHVERTFDGDVERVSAPLTLAHDLFGRVVCEKPDIWTNALAVAIVASLDDHFEIAAILLFPVLFFEKFGGKRELLDGFNNASTVGDFAWHDFVYTTVP